VRIALAHRPPPPARVVKATVTEEPGPVRKFFSNLFQ